MSKRNKQSVINARRKKSGSYHAKRIYSALSPDQQKRELYRIIDKRSDSENNLTYSEQAIYDLELNREMVSGWTRHA